jgi:hypothetical protein
MVDAGSIRVTRCAGIHAAPAATTAMSAATTANVAGSVGDVS